jgi:hypothetical protein
VEGQVESMRSTQYHQFLGELHIIKTQVLYIIIAKDFLCTPKGVMRYKGGVPPLMIYTLTRDDIPLLSQWIKKSSFRRTRIFCHSYPKKNWVKTEDLIPTFFYLIFKNKLCY